MCIPGGGGGGSLANMNKLLADQASSNAPVTQSDPEVIARNNRDQQLRRLMAGDGSTIFAKTNLTAGALAPVKTLIGDA